MLAHQSHLSTLSKEDGASAPDSTMPEVLQPSVMVLPTNEHKAVALSKEPNTP
jgi:hypothetical protein